MLRFTQMQVGSSRVEPQTLQRELFPRPAPAAPRAPSPPPRPAPAAGAPRSPCPGLPLCPQPRSPAPPLDVVPVVARYFPLSAHGSVSAAPRSRLPNPDPATARPHSPVESLVSTSMPRLIWLRRPRRALRWGTQGLTSPGPLVPSTWLGSPRPSPGCRRR